MKLKDFTKMLLALESQGSNAECEVFYRIGSSGDCGPLSSAYITNEVDECGPFGLDDGEFYVSIYGGH